MPAKGWKVGTSLVGQTYGRWQVLAPALDPDKRNGVWFCACECGTFRVVTTSQLRRKRVGSRPISCGCNVVVHGYPHKRIDLDAARFFNTRYLFYKRRAETKLNIEFTLSIEQFASLSRSDCYYCGAPPAMFVRMGNAKPGEPLANGIDRVDNSLGYFLANVVPCCTLCNQMKLTSTQSEFLAHVRRIVAHSIKNT